jgi:hypothetical protein
MGTGELFLFGSFTKRNHEEHEDAKKPGSFGPFASKTVVPQAGRFSARTGRAELADS